MAPDLWMRGSQMKQNSPKYLLNTLNLNSFLLPGSLVHQKYFFHLEFLAGAMSEEQLLYNLQEKTTFKLKLMSRVYQVPCHLKLCIGFFIGKKNEDNKQKPYQNRMLQFNFSNPKTFTQTSSSRQHK